MQPPIANILHNETIQRLAGDGAFARGRAYFQEGRVEGVQRKDGGIVATVRGAESYSVRIWTKEGSLAYACSCPQGRDQAFCKHAVAVALFFVSERMPAIATGAPTPTPPVATAVESPTPPAPPVAPRSAGAESSRSTTSEAPTPAKPAASLADQLRALSHEELVVFVLETALDDSLFRDRLIERLRG
ncbi:MAG: hypothetical protein U0271_14215 [Polyangiaceae bacterium]